VTGANGFVGRATVAALSAAGHDVRAAVRRPSGGRVDGVTEYIVPDLIASRELSAAAQGCDAVAHLAGRAHILDDPSADPLAEFRRVNVLGTEAVLAAAMAGGVTRFLMVSSVKVHGDGGGLSPYRPSDLPAPVDPYGVSKLEAEQAAGAYANRMAVSVLRPPLVYGPGVRGNFRRLLRLLDRSRRVPLPLGGLRNRRSLVFVGNLASAITHLLEIGPNARGTYLVSDGDDLTTTQLLEMTGQALAAPPVLVPIPAWVVRAAGWVLGRSAEVQRLTGTLTVDIAALTETGWRPPFSVAAGLAATASWWTGGGRDEALV